MKYLLYLTILTLGLAACSSSNKYYPTQSFSAEKLPVAPDYTKLENWAAHPDKEDAADRVPSDAPVGTTNNQSTAKADVFFVYPTIYDGTEKYHTEWNADIKDTVLNQKINETTIQHQSSVFNGVGRIFSPRYRQAHLNVYYETANKEDAKAAFEIAYQDVKAAFMHYLKNANEGRPLIIASHSQGTNHTERLIKEMVDKEPLREQFVVAYLVGMPIQKDVFENIPVCETPEQTGCYCTWNAYAKDHYPESWEKDLKNATVTNPINWLTDESYASYDDNQGGVLGKFNYKPKLSDAQIKDGMVWIGTPKVPGAALLRTKRWHYAEYNLFYFNIRSNVEQRLNAFLKE